MKRKINFVLNLSAIIICTGLCVLLRTRDLIKERKKK